MVSWQRIRVIGLGFVGAVVIFGLLFWVVGVERILAELRAARPAYVGFVLVAVVAWLGAWSFALRIVLRSLDITLSIPRAFLVFAGAMFANNVTPFGQAGGEPITAFLVSNAADATYEQGLAAIASVDTLNFVPSISLAALGLGYYATQTTFGRKLRLAAFLVAGLACGIPLLLVGLWHYRDRLERRATALFAPISRWISALPRISVDPAALKRRLETFVGAIERIGTTRRQLSIALGFSTLGWVCQTVALWGAFRALGIEVPLLQLFFIIPIGAIAGLTPLPGGLGGIESVLISLLVAIGVASATAASAVIIFRGIVYWVPTLIGGSVVTVLWLD